MLLKAQVCLAATAGACSHLLIFIRGEHHVQAPTLLRIYLVLGFLLLMSQTSSLRLAAGTTGLLVIVYGGSLFASITIYRTFFHRLRRFPGPVMAK